MFLQSFQVIFQAIFGLVLLGSIGFWLVKRSIVEEEGLKMLSTLVIGLFLPFFMFSEIVERFSFTLYPDWWLYPLLSLLVTAVGYACGLLVLFLDKSSRRNKDEFLAIAAFQNSGYLPLPLVASLLAPDAAKVMFIYIFLFLLGFNMTIFSLGVFLLAPKTKDYRFNFKHMFNPPVIATLLALACVFFKINRILPNFVLSPIEMLGRAAIPLSILVVGGNLASIKAKPASNFKSISYVLALKLFIVPLIFLGFIILVRPQPLVGLLLMLQAAMPSATFLSVISRGLNHQDHLISQAIFYSHIAGILTISLFLALFRPFAAGLF